MIRYKNLPIIISFKLSKNYALELVLLDKIGKYKDWLGLISFACNSEYYKADHCPMFNCNFMLFNVNIFEFSIYNVNHIEDDVPSRKDIEEFFTDPNDPPETSFPVDKER